MAPQSTDVRPPEKAEAAAKPALDTKRDEALRSDGERRPPPPLKEYARIPTAMTAEIMRLQEESREKSQEATEAASEADSARAAAAEAKQAETAARAAEASAEAAENARAEAPEPAQSTAPASGQGTAKAARSAPSFASGLTVVNGATSAPNTLNHQA
ncbi:MAG: hypothetical protein JXQ91_13420 [Vannielia sp.]|uniref:hypothetical protein n=1 Tax=Vannielia sp. TaxID=2813045 RepID=UPI003B8E87AC